MSELDGDVMGRRGAAPFSVANAGKVVEQVEGTLVEPAGSVGEKGFWGIAGGNVHPVEPCALGAAGADAIVFGICQVASAQRCRPGAEDGERGGRRALGTVDDHTFPCADAGLVG